MDDSILVYKVDSQEYASEYLLDSMNWQPFLIHL